MKINLNVKRRFIILLSTLFLACCAFLTVNILNNKKAEAGVSNANWGDLVLNENSSDYGSGLFDVSEYGAHITFSTIPISGLVPSGHRFMVMYFSPDTDYFTLSNNQQGTDIADNAAANTGRFAIRFMYNYDNQGMYYRVMLPNGSTGCPAKDFDINMVNDLWMKDEVATGAIYSITIRIIKVNGKWNLFINDLDFNAAARSVNLGDAFDTYVGGAFKNSSNKMSIRYFNPWDTKDIYVAIGDTRGVSKTEYDYINSGANKLMSGYTYYSDTDGVRSYYNNIDASLMQFSKYGGYVSLDLNILNKPWDGKFPSFYVAFSPDDVLPFTDNASIMSHDGGKQFGKFYLVFMINPGDTGARDGKLYVEPHFQTGMSTNNWSLLGTFGVGGTVNIKFHFKPYEGGWQFIVEAAGGQKDFTSDFQAYLNQGMVFNDAYKLNIGVKGTMQTCSSNYADMYFKEAVTYTRGYDVRTTSYIGEVLSGSPVERMSYYDDATATAKNYIGVGANTAFDVNLKLKIVDASFSDNPTMQIAFGNNSAVMNADSSAINATTKNHFCITLMVNGNGNIYATLIYNNKSDNAWAECSPADFGKVGSYSKTNGAFTDITIQFRRLNTGIDPAYDSDKKTGSWVVLVKCGSADPVPFEGQFNGIIHREATGFMETANKNVAITLGTGKTGTAYTSRVLFPYSVYLTGINTASDDAAISVTKISARDLNTSSNGFNANLTDTLAANSSSYKMYYYNGGKASDVSGYSTYKIAFKFKFTYTASTTWDVKMSTSSTTVTSAGGRRFILGTTSLNGNSYNTLKYTFFNSSTETGYYSVHPFTEGNQYTITCSYYSASNNTSYRVDLIAQDSSGNVVWCGENTGTSTANVGRLIIKNNVALAGAVFTNLFYKDGGTTLQTYDRVEDGKAGIAAPTAEAKTVKIGSVTWKYTFKAWETSSGTAYTSGQAVTSSTKYTAKYTFGDNEQITGEINGQNTSYTQTARIRVTGSTATSGGVTFVNGLSNDLLSMLATAANNTKYIKSYEVGTLASTSASSESALVAGCTGWKIANTVGDYYATDATAKYISAAITGIPVASRNVYIYYRAYVKITNTDGTICYFYGEVKYTRLTDVAYNAVIEYNTKTSNYTREQALIFQALCLNGAKVNP